MMCNKLKINVTPEEIPEKLREAMWILYKMRHYKKVWDQHYGSQNRRNLQEWESRADKFIESIIIKQSEDDEKSNGPGQPTTGGDRIP